MNTDFYIVFVVQSRAFSSSRRGSDDSTSSEDMRELKVWILRVYDSVFGVYETLERAYETAMECVRL